MAWGSSMGLGEQWCGPPARIHVENKPGKARQHYCGQTGGLAEAGRSSGQPEACSGAETSPPSAIWPKAAEQPTLQPTFRHRRACTTRRARCAPRSRCRAPR
eukprot:scaffold26307_cov45-Phaeocystis_antarctica.AAC.1